MEDLIKSVRTHDPAVIVNQGSECFLELGNRCIRLPELDFSHREAEQNLPMKAVYVGLDNSNTVFFVVNDTNIYLSLINIPHYIHSDFYFCQWKQMTRME